MDKIRQKYERTHRRILVWLTVEDYARVENLLADLRQKQRVQMPDGSWREGAKLTKTDLLNMAIHGLLKKHA